MFLHLGGDTVVLTSELVAIINLENAMTSASTREFMKVVEEEGFVRDLSSGQAKSCVVTDRNIYLSPISSTTLRKRANFMKELAAEED